MDHQGIYYLSYTGGKNFGNDFLRSRCIDKAYLAKNYYATKGVYHANEDKNPCDSNQDQFV